jgi:glutaminyl-tRNA synthetase
MGTREIPFSRELYIEQDDFMEDPPKKFFRLAPGREVRLRYAYFIKCHEVVKDPASGQILELRCTYDPETKGGDAPDGRKVKATLHWVSTKHALKAEARIYDHLFKDPYPDVRDISSAINPDSLQIIPEFYIEPGLADLEPGARLQFERLGYFCLDAADTTAEKMVFNRTVPLKDTWARMQKSQENK